MAIQLYDRIATADNTLRSADSERMFKLSVNIFLVLLLAHLCGSCSGNNGLLLLLQQNSRFKTPGFKIR